MAHETKNSLSLGFYYNREVLEGPSDLAIIRNCLNELLGQIAANPETPIGDLGIVSSVEKEKVLTQLAGAINSPTHGGQGIVARIEYHAQTTPQAIAAACGKEKLTYEQLNKNANRLGHGSVRRVWAGNRRWVFSELAV